MQKISIDHAIEQIVKKDPKYPKDAYNFVREALDFTIKEQKKASDKDHHVTGQELLEGVRNFALQQFGPLTFTVLNHWNLKKCEDIGEIVFNMVSMRILKTTKTDSIEDFKQGYSFKDAFQRPFEPSGLRKNHRASPQNIGELS